MEEYCCNDSPKVLFRLHESMAKDSTGWHRQELMDRRRKYKTKANSGEARSKALDTDFLNLQ